MAGNSENPRNVIELLSIFLKLIVALILMMMIYTVISVKNYKARQKSMSPGLGKVVVRVGGQLAAIVVVAVAAYLAN